MSLKKVFQQVSKLSSTASENAKVVLLKEYMQDPLFMKVATFTLDTRRKYNVKKFPKFDVPLQTERSTEFSAVALFEYLDLLNGSPGATNQHKQVLFKLASCDEETYELVKRICNGSLKCGCSVKLFNKAILDSIFSIPYCRCSTDAKIGNIIYPAYAQEKADGMFTNVIVNKKGKVKFLSREGKKIKQLKKLKRLIESNMPTEYFGTVFHGELLSMQDGKVLPRKTGNGIFSSCLYGLAEQALADTAILKIWDAIPIDDFWNESCTIPYEQRFTSVLDVVSTMDQGRFQPVEYEVVFTLTGAEAFYARMRKFGREGAILKNFKMIWKGHTSTNQIKMKNVMDVELNTVSWYYGKEDSKYAKCLGGIICESACEKISVRVGGGYSDGQRGFYPVDRGHPNAILSNDNDKGYTDEDTGEFYPPVYIDSVRLAEALELIEQLMGQVAGLECESIIKNKTKEIHSLYLPRFSEIRVDKKADTLEGLLKR